MLLARRMPVPLKMIFREIKSDRINALKKQYDAFLEEDKKRKDRNEFILGRLDKMRYSTALLPLRHKLGILPDRNIVHYRSAHQLEIPSARDYQLTFANPIQIPQDVPVTKVEGVPETLLIQEISKKYILIPKLTSTLTNKFNINNVKPAPDIEPVVDTKVTKEINISDVDNNDWKSKYEILNILKKEEKEAVPIQISKAMPDIKTDNMLLNNNIKDNINESAVSVNRDLNAGDKYETEIPEKDLPDVLSHQMSTAEANYALTHIYDDSYSVNGNYILDEQTKNISTTSNLMQNDPVAEIGYKLQNTNLKDDNAEQSLTNHPVELTEYEQNVQIEPAYEINTAFDYPNQQNVEMQPEYEVDPAIDNPNQQKLHAANPIENVSNTYHAEGKLSSPVEHDPADQAKDIPFVKNDVLDENISEAQVINRNELLEQVNDASPPADPEVYVGDVEYPVDIINVQEFTPNDDVQLRGGININPEAHNMQQSNIEPSNTDFPQSAVENSQKPVDTIGIEEFETEQQDLFYSEQTGENYAHQGGAADEYSSEYAQNEAYQQNEYAYYEGNQPEDYQPVEINEHEETTQQYDQNYEQQYVGSYEQGYEQQPYEQNKQHDPQYQEPQAYPSQPEVEQLHYQQQNEETLEHVQQVLDNEQGFAEIQNIEQVNEQENLPIVKPNEADNTAFPEKQQVEALES